MEPRPTLYAAGPPLTVNGGLSSRGPRVAALGVDALDLAYVREQGPGRLPNLHRVLRAAQLHRLDAPLALRAETPWTTFVTGRTPAELDYWGAITFDPNRYECWERGASAAAPFYALGPAAQVIALDVPHAQPAPGLRGAEVIAWGAHSPQHPFSARPGPLAAALAGPAGAHPAAGVDSQPAWHDPAYQARLADALCEGAARRAAVLAAAIEQAPDWRLLVTVFGETHAAGHLWRHGVEAAHPLHRHPRAAGAAARLAAVHRAVDQALGASLELVGFGEPDVAVVLFAVHGMRMNTSDVPGQLLVPELLHRAEFGWARLGDPPEAAASPASLGLAPVVPAPGRRSADAVLDRLAEGPGWSARLRTAAARRRRRSGPPVDVWAAAVAAAQAEGGFPRPVEGQGASLYRRWWPAMRAFALATYSDAHLRVNVAGRERCGQVRPERFTHELDRLEALLGACRDARTGRRAVEELVRVRVDPFAPGPPADLVVVFAGPIDTLEHPDLGRIGPVPFLRTGEHDPAGFMALVAPGCRPGPAEPRALLDLPPTILALGGLRPARRLPGRPAGAVPAGAGA